MPIAILVLFLAGYGYALVVLPHLRLPLLVAGVVIGLGSAVYLWRQGPPEAERAAQRITAAELSFDQVDLARSGRGATLTGRVTNGSPLYRLREMSLDLRLRDCPTPETEPADCPTIGESSAISRPDAPPGQIRAFSAHFTFANVPPVAGTLRWDWAVTALRSTE
ncbi:hypothetical protein HNP73_002838 [Amaricoccus macauensis]|uniref:Uncharacterized protein n=1 Tax=Amaricoccus macauensis TaxID=57001 RepID=A0A840SUS0_9RHOB|nr:hypothetical protein [Amaricoccus macauensis]MBB5222891.1 hypothetical protein [Amaricoccus macauensis]